MATIIGGIGTSHVPTIGVAYDKGKRNDPAWAPLFEGYEPVARWLAEQRDSDEQPEDAGYVEDDDGEGFRYERDGGGLGLR